MTWAGPIFSREALTLPRQMRHFLIRSGYVAALFVLIMGSVLGLPAL